MGKAKIASNFLPPEKVKNLSTTKIPKDLEDPRKTSFPFSGTSYTDLTNTAVYNKLMEGEWFLAPPETTKKSDAWKTGSFRLVVEKADDGSYCRTGHILHHVENNGKYCGWMTFQNAKKSSPKQVTHHHQKCDVAGHNDAEKKPAAKQLTLEESIKSNKKFPVPNPAVKAINKSLCEWLHSSCRSYETANDPLFSEVLKTAFEQGAKQGKNHRLKFDINSSTFADSDYVRKSLNRHYNNTVDFWKPIIKQAYDEGILTIYTDIGKDKVNKRLMCNICVSFSLPAMPDIIFDLVLCTKSYESALLEAAENNQEIHDEIIQDLFKKDGKNIMAVIREELEKYGIKGNFFVVADRASENLKAFGRFYICCIAHQFDLVLKYAEAQMKKNFIDGILILSIEAMKEVTNFANSREMKFTYEKNERTHEITLTNPATTRWAGKVDQARKVLKVEGSIVSKAQDHADMLPIVNKLNFACLKKFVTASDFVKTGIMDCQILLQPNIHLGIHQVIKILKEARKHTDGNTELAHYWRFIVIGVCHKVLRVFDVPHFTAYLFSPCFNEIPDLNNFLPWNKQWFVRALAAADYRTAHKCVKNSINQYSPTWLAAGQTIMDAVVERFAEHLVSSVSADDSGNSSETEDEESDDEGILPNFVNMQALPDSGVDNQSSLVLAREMIDRYVKHHKGYRSQDPQSDNRRKNRTHNKNLSLSYLKNPKEFWCDSRLTSDLSSQLKRYAVFVFSIRSGAVKCESEFSRMSWMISARRSSYTAENANKRLTMGNLLPQKRKLEQEMEKRKIKKRKLFHFK